MRAKILAVAAAAAILVPLSAVSQTFEIGPGGVRIGGSRGESRRCEQLRLACENRDRLGERGEGNCRRYRQACGRPDRMERGPSRAEMCRDLRQACLNKDQLGEQGQGNCRRYRRMCR